MSGECLNCCQFLDEHRHPDSACPLPREYRGLHAGFSDVLSFQSRRVVLGQEGFDEFVAALDRAPRGLSRLSDLMRRPSPFGWDEKEV